MPAGDITVSSGSCHLQTAANGRQNVRFFATTGYSAFSTQRRASSPAPGSMTAASQLCCTMNYIGLTFQSVFSSSWASQCIVAYRIRLRFTWSTAVVESQTLWVDAIYDQRVNTIWLYYVTGWVPLIVGRSLMLDRQFGTLYHIASVTRRSAVTVLDACWKRNCLRYVQRIQRSRDNITNIWLTLTLIF